MSRKKRKRKDREQEESNGIRKGIALPPSTQYGVDLEWLRYRCFESMLDIASDVVALGGVKTDCPNGEWYVHLNRGSKILAVAHLDTVNPPTHFTVGMDTIRTRSFEPVFCETLDDRLGVHTILDVLPRLGIKVDILFTTGEEKGRTSAAHFKTEAKYNWIVEFDRRGEDVVLYDYDLDEGIESALKGSGFKVGVGSFSDISSMEDLKVTAFNLGIGYHNEHDFTSWLDMGAYERQMKRFAHFHYHNAEKAYTHVERVRPYSRGAWGTRGEYGGYAGGYEGYEYFPRYHEKQASLVLQTCAKCAITTNIEHMSHDPTRGWLCTACNDKDGEDDGMYLDRLWCPECGELVMVEDLEVSAFEVDGKRVKVCTCPVCLTDITEEVEHHMAWVSDREKVMNTTGKDGMATWPDTMVG